MLIRGNGGGGGFYAEDYSFVMVESTSVLGQGTGGVWEVHPGYNSSLYMSGGQVHEIAIINYATAFLSGGLIEQIWSQQYAWKYYYQDGPYPPIPIHDPHIEIICREYNYNTATKKLTGLWNVDANNNGLFDPFNIQLINVQGYSSAIENIRFTIIPEPVTVLLLAAGGLLLRKRV